MRKILAYTYFLFVLLLSLTMTSCSDGLDSDSEKNGITLTVSTSGLLAKATMAGDDDLNENQIKYLHYFIYQNGKTSESPVLSGFVKPNKPVTESMTISIEVDEATLREDLFPSNGRSCDVYIIANLPEDVELPSVCSIDNLKALELDTFFADADGSFLRQECFVMDGSGKAEVISLRNVIVAEGNISLKRLASKISLATTVESSYTDEEGVVWTPDVEGMTLELVNCSNNILLNGIAGDVEPERFDYSPRSHISEGNSGRYSFEPFYSYPCSWHLRSEDELVFRIKLPWTDNAGRWQPCYYKVLLNTTELVRNTYYHVNVNIGILGSFSPQEDPVELQNLSYLVVDWRNGLNDFSGGVEEEVDILAAHYLVLEKNVWEMHNQENLTIPYISSDKCVVKDIEIIRDNYQDSNNNYDSDGTKPLTVFLTSDPQNPLATYVAVSHELVNDLSDENADYLPYTVTFTICHESNQDKFYEEVTVVQYPANYITRETNSYYDSRNPTKDVDGSVYVNGDGPATNANGDFGGCYGIYGGTTNSNPSRYVIRTTVLENGSSYIIGDPRKDVIDNISGGNPGWTTAPDMNGTRRGLQFYYPTDDSDNTKTMVSPEFMIASSYGVTNEKSYDDMRRRCASYQEDGYPAGRWRMPTLAELEYITTLSAKGVIPTLFNNGSAYWCAHGTATPKAGGDVTSSNDKSGSHSVRCVYDTWYWDNRLSDNPSTNADERAVFTWGDKAR